MRCPCLSCLCRSCPFPGAVRWGRAVVEGCSCLGIALQRTGKSKLRCLVSLLVPLAHHAHTHSQPRPVRSLAWHRPQTPAFACPELPSLCNASPGPIVPCTAACSACLLCTSLASGTFRIYDAWLPWPRTLAQHRSISSFSLFDLPGDRT